MTSLFVFQVSPGLVYYPEYH